MLLSNFQKRKNDKVVESLFKEVELPLFKEVELPLLLDNISR